MNRFREKAEQMVQLIPTLDERKKAIEELNEECYQELGRFLAPDILDKLGDWLFHEIYSDKSTNKAQTAEYPVLSKYQIKRRNRKSVLMASEESMSILSHHLKNNSTIRNKDRIELWENDNE